jgi:hypothetical protein
VREAYGVVYFFGQQQGRETFGPDAPRDNDDDVSRTLRLRSLDLAGKGTDSINPIYGSASYELSLLPCRRQQ